MPIEPRLIVTGHSPEGEAIFVEDRRPESVTVQALPGADFYLLWGTPDGRPRVGEKDAAPVLRPYFPGLGGSRALFLRWAAHSSEPEPVADPADIASEVADKLPGLLDPFEDDGDGMHTTDTIDYAICLEGELCLTLDNGVEKTLTPGTCVIQLGTRHAWHNRSDRPALMCYVQIGAVRV
ncbi:cupin domain-containing protein [Actinoplanes sp. NBRC 103695]|uniref:cupin domain-containing protein n=1 Tax=Actinoplanes sp. NBRC 103695 TaxID=3032202 RepID=UPI0024A5B0FE|nr:cupin domain-containing protein [Actinoplanes sp. NBRC 103695]GLY93966.1 cupin [Actinoplanes sp. NBRC 103695]